MRCINEIYIFANKIYLYIYVLFLYIYIYIFANNIQHYFKQIQIK